VGLGFEGFWCFVGFGVLRFLFGVFSCSCGGPQGLGWGFRCGCCFGFLRVCAFFLFSLSRCSFCILSVYLGAPHACFLIKFDL
jgi:hypothetical protein